MEGSPDIPPQLLMLELELQVGVGGEEVFQSRLSD